MSDILHNHMSDQRKSDGNDKADYQENMPSTNVSPSVNGSADRFANHTGENVFASNVSSLPPPPEQSSVSVDDIFSNETARDNGEAVNGSSVHDSNNYPAPASPIVDKSIIEKLNENIRKRTAAIDAATKAKETEILSAAKKYLQDRTKQFEQDVKAAKANQQKTEKEQESKIEEYKKTGAVWSAVNMLVDLKHPNTYSKGTEHMRGLLTSLDGNKTVTEAVTK